ncbi:BTAD domain-containing putative transcriptional regulator [Pelagibius marinus]|uniref:BTAD domain-containing putative transcriptional regulator n=1 Tax=Pelagibius marinus TaxID=2762760 RepID=UPI0018727FF6|nr:tetratricopeptide repeat protein [Pelagibius marinus]
MPLALFGGITVTAPSGDAVTLPTRKTALVLAVLALLGDKGATRDALAEWIWPERAEGQGKSSLRQALTAIRKALPAVLDGAAVETEQDTVKLSGGAELIDLHRFEALARGGGRGALAEAAGLYSGELLEGIPLSGSLEHLVAAQRAQLRQEALELAERLSEEAGLSKSEQAACEALANRLLAKDPAAEAAHRALIRLRLAEGQPNAARRQLERCAEAVLRDLGVEPEARTLALLDDGAPPPAGPGGQTAPEAPAEPAAAKAASDRHGQPSVVVMPFDDLGGQEGDFFADGVVEEITSALSRIKDFFVIARQSAYSYKGRFVDVREVGRDLGVDYAVEGTVRRGGERVRITVQLVETESGRQLWSERYEDNRSELFDLQDRIASQVAGAINPSIRASEIERAKQTPPEDLQAYDLMLQALPHFWAHRKEDNLTALKLFDRALERDPDYGVALAFKAWCHAQQACYLWTDDPARERAQAVAAAEQAALKVQDHATALAAIGAAYGMTTSDLARAEGFIERSLALDPNNAWGWMRAGWQRLFAKDFASATANYKRALALSPFDPFTFNMHFGLSIAEAEQGHYEKAIGLVEQGLREGPGVTWAYRMLAAYHAQLGNKEKSAEAMNQFLRHYPGVTIEFMRQSLPPSLHDSTPAYWEGMRKAGFPEK